MAVDREEIVGGRLRRYYRLAPPGAELLAGEAARMRAAASLALTILLAPLVLAVLLLGQDLGWMASLLWHTWDGSTGPFAPAWPVAVVLAPLAFPHLDPFAMSTAAAQAALYLPPALLAGVAAVAISRSAGGPAGRAG